MIPTEALAKLDAAITEMGLEQEDGNAASTSQYGEPYIVMINGFITEEGKACRACDLLETAVDRQIAWFKSLAVDADSDYHVCSIVWRLRPEISQRPFPARRFDDDPRAQWKLYCRFHMRRKHTTKLPATISPTRYGDGYREPRRRSIQDHYKKIAVVEK